MFIGGWNADEEAEMVVMVGGFEGGQEGRGFFRHGGWGVGYFLGFQRLHLLNEKRFELM